MLHKFLLLCSFFSLILSINKFLIPNPRKSPSLCNRKNEESLPTFTSSICDVNSYLSKNELDVLEGRINNIQNVELGIAIVKEMEVVSESEIDDLAREYAMYLHNQWGIGDKDKQNGILIFLSINDRAIFISRGKGLEKDLNSIVISLLIDHMKPYLREKQYGKALEASLIEIDILINDKVNSELQKSAVFQSRINMAINGVILLGVFGIFYLAYRSKMKEKNLKRGEKALSRLMKDVTNESENKFQFTSCPICLEEFQYPHKQQQDPLIDQENNHSNIQLLGQSNYSFISFLFYYLLILSTYSISNL